MKEGKKWSKSAVHKLPNFATLAFSLEGVLSVIRLPLHEHPAWSLLTSLFLLVTMDTHSDEVSRLSSHPKLLMLHDLFDIGY